MHTFNQSNLSKVQIWTRHCSLQIEGHLKVVSSEKRKSFAKNFALFCISFARQKSKKFRFFQKREIIYYDIKKSWALRAKNSTSFFAKFRFVFAFIGLISPNTKVFCSLESYRYYIFSIHIQLVPTNIGMDWIDANSSSPLSSSKEEIETICYIKKITFSSLFLLQFKNCKDDIT